MRILLWVEIGKGSGENATSFPNHVAHNLQKYKIYGLYNKSISFKIEQVLNYTYYHIKGW